MVEELRQVLAQVEALPMDIQRQIAALIEQAVILYQKAERHQIYSQAWLDGLDEALAQDEAGQGIFASSGEEFFRLLDEAYEQRASS
jgi:hypothetical protein